MDDRRDILGYSLYKYIQTNYYTYLRFCISQTTYPILPAITTTITIHHNKPLAPLFSSNSLQVPVYEYHHHQIQYRYHRIHPNHLVSTTRIYPLIYQIFHRIYLPNKLFIDRLSSVKTHEINNIYTNI